MLSAADFTHAHKKTPEDESGAYNQWHHSPVWVLQYSFIIAHLTASQAF